MPHGACYLWKPEIVWLHAISDGSIALSYYVIPLFLISFVRQRKDLPFNWIFVMFGVFIFGCGTTHVMEIWTLWHPTYRLAGVIKALTAVVSIATAAMLVKLIPHALALPSPTQLRTANLRLEGEIKERNRIERALHRAHDELEARVQERTAELASANEELRSEIFKRQQAQEALQTTQSALAQVTRESAAHRHRHQRQCVQALARWRDTEPGRGRSGSDSDDQRRKPGEWPDQGDPLVCKEISSADRPGGDQRSYSRDRAVGQ